MLNSSMKVSDFFKSLLQRPDGWLFIFSCIVCFVLFVLNFFAPMAEFFGIHSSDKWLALWATWPVVLFAGHVRLRTLFDGTELIVLLCHAALIPGSVIYFILKNMGVV